MFRGFCRVLAGGAMLALASGSAFASDSFPNRSIRVVVNSGPGGFDAFMRILLPPLSEATGQNWYIENKPGGGGTIGANDVSKSPADGHTLLYAAIGTMTVTPAVFTKLKFDPLTTLTPIALIGSGPQIWAAYPASGFKTLREIVEAARRAPGTLNFGYPGGPGTLSHLLVADMAGRHKLDVALVSYPGSAQARTATIRGETVVTLDNFGGLRGDFQGGLLRPVAVTVKNRVAILPETPTVFELGLAEEEVIAWYGLFAPPSMPRELVAKLNALINQALRTPAVAERYKDLSVTPGQNSQEEFVQLIRADLARFQRIARDGNIRVD